jgi:hypothetical protein
MTPFTTAAVTLVRDPRNDEWRLAVTVGHETSYIDLSPGEHDELLAQGVPEEGS